SALQAAWRSPSVKVLAMPRLRCLLMFLTIAAFHACPSSAHCADIIDPKRAETDPGGAIVWYDLRLLDVEGKGCADTKGPYDHLPVLTEVKTFALEKANEAVSRLRWGQVRGAEVLLLHGRAT